MITEKINKNPVYAVVYDDIEGVDIIALTTDFDKAIKISTAYRADDIIEMDDGDTDHRPLPPPIIQKEQTPMERFYTNQLLESVRKRIK